MKKQNKSATNLTAQLPIKIALPTHDFNEILLSPAEVIYVMAQGNKCKVVYKHRNKTTYAIVNKLLKEMEEILLYPTIIRIHHSYLINANFAETINYRSHYFVMEDNFVISFSAQFKPVIEKIIRHTHHTHH